MQSADLEPHSRKAALALYWPLLPYLLMSVVHVAALAARSDAWASPTKLLLMPLLIVGAVVLARGWRAPRAVVAALVLALVASWVGDGAGTFFPTLPTLPLMMGFFAVAHLVYVWLFVTRVGTRPVRRWAWVVYPLWWVAMVTTVAPHAGVLFWGVVGYGVVLAGTALTSTKGSTLLALGGAAFLTSDTILGFQSFLDPPWWTSPLVMATYTLGQGLIALGALHARLEP